MVRLLRHLFGVETVTYLALREGNLTFLSAKSRPTARPCTVRLLVKRGPQPAYVEATVEPTSVRQGPSGLGYICVAKVLELGELPGVGGVLYCGQLQRDLAACSGLGEADDQVLQWLQDPFQMIA